MFVRNFKAQELVLAAISASLDAGKEIMEVYGSADFGVSLKSDKSPLTVADQKAHKAILSVLNGFGIPVLSEEGEHLGFEARKSWERCWIVDPLDGTKEFINRNDEFTVNIALVEKGQPTAGVIYVPVLRQLYFSDLGFGAWRKDQIVDWEGDLKQLINVSIALPLEKNRDSLKVVGSRSHMNQETEDFIRSLQLESTKVETVFRGSSLKMCMVAEGEADIYPRYAPTMEWDIAAGHAIVLAAGGEVLCADSGNELSYNKESLLNPWFVCKSKAQRTKLMW